jgi:GxxExxY protein
MEPNELTRLIIGAAIEVHCELGPGKPEAAYESALARELALRGLVHRTQKAVPVVYKGVKLDCGYRLDVLVAGTVVVEVKAVETLIPVHRAQVLTYLKLGGWKIALLLNFNVATLKEGLERLVLGLEEENRRTAPKSGREEMRVDSEPPSLCSARHSGDSEAERLAGETIAGAAEVHRELGPGLLPSAYEACLCHELHLRGVPFETRRALDLEYKGAPLGVADELALFVGGKVIVKPCAIPVIQPVHEAELLSQLRLSGTTLGLLINFGSLRLAEGLRRVVNSASGRRAVRTK